MYYLVYGYEGDINFSQEEIKKEVLSSLNLEESLTEEMSTVYSKKVNWKMFIPPLPAHDGSFFNLVTVINCHLSLFIHFYVYFRLWRRMESYE